jgi:hypothetical protein
MRATLLRQVVVNRFNSWLVALPDNWFWEIPVVRFARFNRPSTAKVCFNYFLQTGSYLMVPESKCRIRPFPQMLSWARCSPFGMSMPEPSFVDWRMRCP